MGGTDLEGLPVTKPIAQYPVKGDGDVCACDACVSRRAVPDLQLRSGEKGVPVSPSAVRGMR
jgi:hypothetical protein